MYKVSSALSINAAGLLCFWFPLLFTMQLLFLDDIKLSKIIAYYQKSLHKLNKRPIF